jgi:hypothetical protein
MSILRLPALILASAVLVALSPAAGAAPTARLQQRFFLSPSGNISCELDYDSSHPTKSPPTTAFCQTVSPGRSVTMNPKGRLKVCSGQKCIGNPPENASTLQYGRSTRLGPFTCKSLRAGIRCRISGGAGFEIGRAGVERLEGTRRGR